MIVLDEQAVAKLGGKVTVKSVPPAPPSSEVVALLSEMKRFSAAVVSVLQKEDAPEAPDPAPIVNVSPPNVQVSVPPSVPAPRRWRFTVTQRDNTAQQRIKEIVVEALE